MGNSTIARNACIALHSYQDYEKLLEQRACLDYRRLEEAHLKFCILRAQKEYPDHLSKLTLQHSVNDTLEEMTPIYFKAFSDRYKCMLNMHVCTFVNSTRLSVLVSV